MSSASRNVLSRKRDFAEFEICKPGAEMNANANVTISVSHVTYRLQSSRYDSPADVEGKNGGRPEIYDTIPDWRGETRDTAR